MLSEPNKSDVVITYPLSYLHYLDERGCLEKWPECRGRKNKGLTLSLTTWETLVKAHTLPVPKFLQTSVRELDKVNWCVSKFRSCEDAWAASSSRRRSWCVGWGPPAEGSCTQDIYLGVDPKPKHLLPFFFMKNVSSEMPHLYPPSVPDLGAQSSSWSALVHHSEMKSKTITLLCEWRLRVCRLDWLACLQRPD